MIHCSKCRRNFDHEDARCPHCGEPSPQSSGLFQTSIVLVCAGRAHRAYRSVDQVPVPLRTRLLRSTSGANSATILIADRGGREQIAKAMRRLPVRAQRNWFGRGLVQWLTPTRKRSLLALLALLTLALVGLVFGNRWQ